MYEAKKTFSYNGVVYHNGDEVKVNTKEELIKMNEKGFIKPLTSKQIQNFGKEKSKVKEKENNKKEEE